MKTFKKISIALILAVAAVFTATAADACKKIEIPKSAVLDTKTSDGIFAWYKTADGRRFLKYVHEKPATIYTVTIPYDGVCNPGRQMMMYHPENYSKGILSSKATIKLVPGTLHKSVKDAGTLLPGTLVAEFEAIEVAQTAVAGGDVAVVEIVHAVDDAAQVAYTVTVAVRKGTDEYLVENAIVVVDGVHHLYVGLGGLFFTRGCYYHRTHKHENDNEK